jgi:spoIIIJ-associated protein
MEWVETTGRTVEAALDAALDELGVDEDDVEYEVLEQPRSGLLGRLTAGEARVRARVKPLSREKPGERQRRNRRGGTRPRSEAGGDPAPAAVDGDRTDAPSRPRRRRGARGSSRSGGERAGAGNPAGTGSGGSTRTATVERSRAEGATVDTDERSVPIEEQGRVAEDFTRKLVDAFDLGASVQLVIEDEAVLLDITGSNLGLLVGPRGATLSAIEELVRTVVQRETDGHGARINVDVGGYRAKRRAALEDFTRSLAEQVIDTGRPLRLEPMSSADRKVVHDTAAEIEGVVTESEGEDPRRRVVLRPA